MDTYSSMSVKDLKSLLIKRNAKTTGKKPDLIERLRYLDSATGSSPGSSIGFDGCDNVAWPDLAKFIHVNEAVPKNDMNVAKVGVYFLEHNVSVSRCSKVQKSGFAMFKEGFLCTCSYTTRDKTLFLRAAVFAEMKKDVTYLVECRTEDGEIAYTSCECTAGRGPNATCKHVAVVLYNLENYERTGTWILFKSCTDEAQSWPHKPKKRMLDPYEAKTPEDIVDVNDEHAYLADPRPAKFQKLDPSAKRQRLEMMLANYLSKRSDSDCLHLHEICRGQANVPAVIDDHDYLEPSLAEALIDRATKVTKEEAGTLERKTRGQAASSLWAAERRVRLTASSAHRVCNVKNKESLAACLYDARSLGHLPAVRWGKANEAAALKKYSEVSGRVVQKCGLFVCVDTPFLAASPDGVCSDRLVEVKCPYKKEVRENESLLNAGYLPLARDENGEVKLKESHPYFYQIQLQLHVTGHNLCDFVVYTPKDLCIVEVRKDESFTSSMVKRLTSFYETYYKPLLSHRLFGCGL